MKTKINIIITALIAATFLFSCDNNSKTHAEEENLSVDAHSHTEHSHEKNEKNGSACKAPLTPEDSVKFYAKELVVKGEVEFPLSLTVDSLKKMNVLALDSFNIVCQTGATTSENISFRGVLLKEILEKAKIIQHNHKDRNFYIVARATDNYKATFSWAEIFNNPTGENIYVIFEENDLPIRKGAFVLNTTNDIKTGPRHVYWLNSIEIYRVD